jgi:hypothetical protein
MASFATNRGAYRFIEYSLKGTWAGGSKPSVFKIVLITGTPAPTRATNTFSGLTEIAAGNGYTSGGEDMAAFASWTYSEDDTSNWARGQSTSVVWTASGGTLPASGDPIRYAVITDDNATLANREVLGVIDLSEEITLLSGQGLSVGVPGFEIRT